MRRLALALAAILLAGVVSASAAEKTFTITTEPYPPYIGSDLQNQGWTMEVARAVLEPLGYEVELHLRPWARAMSQSKAGHFDGLYLSFYVEERKEWYAFSDPVGVVRTGFFKLKDRNISFETLSDLTDYRIGLTRGASVSPEFDAADYLDKREANNDLVNLTLLLNGRIDLYAGPEAVARHLLNEHFTPEERNRVEFVEPALAANHLHMAVSKNAPAYQQKLADFNAGLAEIKSSGTYDAILRRHGF